MQVRWQVAHADELTKFRAEMNARCSAINMLLLTASVYIKDECMSKIAPKNWPESMYWLLYCG